MDSAQTWITTFIAFGGLLGTLVTAVATLFLWRVTKLLAVETKRMAEASAQPHVVATLDPNRWSMRHFDLKVDNTGNATAYDIKVDFTPPLINGEGRAGGMAVPFENISLLKPGQGVSSYLAEYPLVRKQVYSVRVSWRRSFADSTPRGKHLHHQHGGSPGRKRFGWRPDGKNCQRSGKNTRGPAISCPGKQAPEN